MASISEQIREVKNFQLQRVLDAIFRDMIAAPPAAITSVVAAGANPTKAEYDALRADVIALRATLALLTKTTV